MGKTLGLRDLGRASEEARGKSRSMVWCFGFRVRGLRFRFGVWGLGFGVWGLGSRGLCQGFGLRAEREGEGVGGEGLVI